MNRSIALRYQLFSAVSIRIMPGRIPDSSLAFRLIGFMFANSNHKQFFQLHLIIIPLNVVVAHSALRLFTGLINAALMD